MAWFETNIPANWQDALGRKTGAKISIKAVFDPDDQAVVLSGSHGLESAAPISQERDLDIDYSGRAVVQDLALTFYDPDNYFNPDNSASPFHITEATMLAPAFATDTSISVAFYGNSTFAAGETVIIGDGENEEEIEIDELTGTAGHENRGITITSGLANGYAAGTRIWTKPIVGREIALYLVNLTETTAEELAIMRGHIVRAPETTQGRAKITISDSRKKQLNTIIVGADSDVDWKLKTVDENGEVVSSILWGEQFNVDPLSFTLESGALPGGVILDSETGEISGTPTAAGSFSFTVLITNGNGETISQEMSMDVISQVNSEFLESVGLGDYTIAEPNGSISITLANKLNISCTNNATYLHHWDNVHGWEFGDNIEPMGCYFTPDGITGNWTLITRIDAANYPNHTYYAFAGIFVMPHQTSGGDPLEGVIVGFRKNKGEVSLFNVWAKNNYGTTTGLASELLFKIKKVGTAYSGYYKAPGGTWTLLGTTSCGWTPAHLGICYCEADYNAGGPYVEYLSPDFDAEYLRFYAGTLSLDTTALPSTIPGDDYSYTMLASGGAGEYAWDITIGTLPAGLSLDADTGEISGTPTAEGSSTFTVRVTDGDGATDTASLTISVDGDMQILPDVFPWGVEGYSYSEDLRLYIGGSLARADVVIGSRCPLGHWNFTFTSSTEFEVETPGLGVFTGDITSDFTIAEVITIPSTAWMAGMALGDSMSFITGITWVKQNPVTVIYSILTELAGISPAQLHASSFFGDIPIGTISEHDTGTEEVKISTVLPAVLKTGETLEINETEIDVATGNTTATGWPPEIEIELDTTSEDYAGEAVIWKARSDPDDDWTFDAEYNHCLSGGLLISITLDRQITIAEAVEAVGAHGQIFQFQDFGVDHLHSFRPRYQETIPEIGDSYLKGDLALSTIEIANVITIKYQYDYFNEEYLSSVTFPGADADNPSFLRHGIVVEKTIFAPGIYTDSQALSLAQRIYEMYANGLRVVRPNLDLKGITLRLGTKIAVECDDPAVDANFEIIGKAVKVTGGKNVQVAAFDSKVFEKYLIAGSGMAGVSCVW